MSIKVTLDLPNSVIEHAKLYSQSTESTLEDVLTDSLEILWPRLDNPSLDKLYEDVAALSNKEVIDLANLKMNPEQNERLGDLQAKGKAERLTQTEQIELLAFMQIYRLGLLRKAQGLAEAVRRGLRSPLHP
ncbi:MAG: hypothetical protein KF832_15395 [Caldilineaceae bacterium]|nr:hypothetical protein [Caldilineaceae bacterium]